MARSSVVLMLVAALLVSSTMAQSPASSPASSPAMSPPALARKAKALSPTVAIPSANSPLASPPVESGSAPSPLSSTPSEAPAPAGSGAVLNRFSVTGSVAVVIFAAALLM